MIIYRTRSHLPPPWLTSCASRPDDGWHIHADCDACILSAPGDADWRDIGDDAHACIVGELDPITLARPRIDLDDGTTRIVAPDGFGLAVIAAKDIQGRSWLVPVIATPDGSPVLPQPWGIGLDGKPTRNATPLQKELLSIANDAHSAIQGGLEDVPLEVAAYWATTLLAAVLQIPAKAILALGLLDDYLAVRVLLASFGSTCDGES